MTASIVSLAGSGLVFNNTFSANCTAQFISCVVAAENDLQSHWTNAQSINVSFDEVASGTSGFLASNTFGILEYSYSAVANALKAHASSADAQASAATLPLTDPSNGALWELPVAYARMLGLTSQTPAADDSVTLNSSYKWAYGQDVIGTIEHEITEGGMGRIGSLGTDGGDWSTMDLFRYSAPGVRDYTDGQDSLRTHFSVDGTALSSLTYNNQYSGLRHVNSGDTADFTQLDVFGTGNPGQGLTLSSTDVQIMNVLGWTPPGAAPSSSNFVHSGTWTTADSGSEGWYVGDFNGDGKDDIFSYLPGQSGAHVLLSTGSSFSDQGSWTGAGSGSDGIWHLGDFNGDGKTDIFRYLPGQSGADVFLSTGSSFQHVGSWTGAGEGSDGKWYIGDFNGDGTDDLFRSTPGIGVEVFLSTGSSFAYAGVWTPAGDGNGGWYLGDFNHDGKVDIARDVTGSGLQVFLSDGSSFQSAGVWTSASPVNGNWTIGDFNGSGGADLLRYVSGQTGADVFLNTGTGSAGQIAQAQSSEVDSAPAQVTTHMTAADVADSPTVLSDAEFNAVLANLGSGHTADSAAAVASSGSAAPLMIGADVSSPSTPSGDTGLTSATGVTLADTHLSGDVHPTAHASDFFLV